MKIKRFIGGQLESNGYVIYGDNSKECVIIDPGYNSRVFDDFIEKKELSLKAILLTHFHYDHVGAVEKLYKPEAPILIHLADLSWLPNKLQKITKHIEEGFKIPIGGEELHTIHLPGHTQGGMAFYSKKLKIIFTGDVLFDDDIGRTDLPEGSPEDMAESCHKLDELIENDWIVYSGHGDSATMKKIREINFEFKNALSYYEKIKK